MTITQEAIHKIRAGDRQRVFTAALAAAVIHYVLIMFVRFSDSPPKVFDVPPPENLVVIRRYSPPRLPPEATAAASQGDPTAAEGLQAGAPAPASTESGPARIGPEGVPPQVLERVEPQYPRSAKEARIRGIVTLDVVILQDGSVGEIAVRTSLGKSGCDEAAVEAVKRSKFLAGSVNGRPVDALLTLDYRFQ